MGLAVGGLLTRWEGGRWALRGLGPARPGRARLGMALEPLLWLHCSKSGRFFGAAWRSAGYGEAVGECACFLYIYIYIHTCIYIYIYIHRWADGRPTSRALLWGKCFVEVSRAVPHGLEPGGAPIQDSTVYSRCCIRICSAMVAVPHRPLLPSLPTDAKAGR